MNDNLAPVFLDNKPISLNDPKPKLSAILSASGRPETTDVKWLQFQPNTPGKSLRSEEVLDRTTDPSKPIYLTSGKGQWSGGQPQSGGGQGQSGGGPGVQRREGDIDASSGQTTDGKPSTHQGDDSGMQDDNEAGGEAGKKSGDHP